MTSNEYNSNGYKVVSPIGRLRRMDDDIMMPSHSTLWRKRSEVTKDIEDMALPLLLLLLWFGKIWHYYYFDMKNMALPPLLLLLWYCNIWHYCYYIYYNFYVVLGRHERPAELSSEPSRQEVRSMSSPTKVFIAFLKSKYFACLSAFREYEGQGCISCGTCSYPKLTEDHVLTSAYVKIFRTVTRNAVNKGVWRKKIVLDEP